MFCLKYLETWIHKEYFKVACAKDDVLSTKILIAYGIVVFLGRTHIRNHLGPLQIPMLFMIIIQGYENSKSNAIHIIVDIYVFTYNYLFLKQPQLVGFLKAQKLFDHNKIIFHIIYYNKLLKLIRIF